ncbi:alpha-hydroxy acid oxidase [Bordetella sp. 15P40C-2]|uniref:alpha-hydroxy acid oxidase n=1 Tax=Bordetella sp. 15P40C-2 TaxID=2572246 RepID=UPI00132BE664|nr:alpha-hydroxy acid oxidase [Bordetella sp. 15P40C-2]MVW70751.1 alpha-hydroxy-acid oxidizing protein [Bordetella sp. 15P40C-2]
MTTTYPPTTPSSQAAYEARTDGLPAAIRNALNLNDFERAAARYLPGPLREYVLGAAEDNRSLAANRAAFQQYQLITRVLADVSRRSTQTTLFGRSYRVPFGVAPVGISALLAYEGDLAMARAAQQVGACMIMSGSSLMRLEDIHENAPGSWFQAYLPGDAARRSALIERVRRAGYETLVITVDIPVWANRENNIRAGFSLPLRPSLRLAWEGVTHPGWLTRTLLRTLATRGMPYFENSFAERGAPAFSAKAVRDTTGRDHLTWVDIATIRRQWRGNLVIKGILSVPDARQALAVGVDGIIVSNHGGRQLDGAAAPLRVLPTIADAVGHRMTVMMDGGIRRGSDVLIALSLGARYVFTGRPFICAAAIGGQIGVVRASELLQAEIDRNMAMLGVSRLNELGPHCLLQV